MSASSAEAEGFDLPFFLCFFFSFLSAFCKKAVGREFTKQFQSLKVIYRPGPPRGPR